MDLKKEVSESDGELNDLSACAVSKPTGFDLNQQNSPDSGRATGLASSLLPVDSPATTTPNGPNPIYEFEIPNSLVGRIIGAKGKLIKELGRRTGAYMQIRKHHKTTKVDTHQICKVSGKHEKIDRCMQMLRKRFPPRKFPGLNLDPVLPPAPLTNLANLDPETMDVKMEVSESTGGLNDVEQMEVKNENAEKKSDENPQKEVIYSVTDASVYFKFPNVSKLTSEPVYHKPAVLNGVEWLVSLHKNGDFLACTVAGKAINGDIFPNATVEFDLNSAEDNSYAHYKTLEKRIHEGTHFYENLQFIPIEELLDPKEELVTDDTVTVGVHIDFRPCEN